MRIGIILHGPEIVDTGSASQIIGIFEKKHDVTAKLGGTMGRTAVLDAGLEDVIDISQGLTPSETILALKDSIDLAILLNHGKTHETGRSFGRIIASKLPAGSTPFIHIERPDSDGSIIYYCARAKPCAEYARDVLAQHNELYRLPIERGIRVPSYVRLDGDYVIRRVSGVFPGENIRLNGVVIGEAVNEEPEIVCKNGKVVKLRGGKIKTHGLEKLENRKIDLFTAKIKTGNIRRSLHKPKIKPVDAVLEKTVAIIDHCAESTFELVKDAGMVITVGDDTTAIAADILARFGIPVIGITDGDLDGVLEDTIVPSESVIIRVKEGFDDIVGREIFETIMDGKQQIHVKDIDELLARILALSEKHIVDAVYY